MLMRGAPTSFEGATTPSLTRWEQGDNHELRRFRQFRRHTSQQFLLCFGAWYVCCFVWQIY